MKHASILKNGNSTAATAEQLEKINAFSRRALNAEEVYIFSMVLCDNDVDRDFERFSSDALDTLAALFVGKTGIFDHIPKGENQTARIFQTQVDCDENRQTASGEPYRALRAWAYMVRCDKNADLILEIDAGIKKEVSVGCAVSSVTCSVCGADMRTAPCSHQPGSQYNGLLCWNELSNPTDAYEWSFVAVPAQKHAGVTKSAFLSASDDPLKTLQAGGSVTLSKAQASELVSRFRALDALADCGRSRLEELRRDVVRLAAFAAPELDSTVLGEVASMLDERQLSAFRKGFSSFAPLFCQLSGKPDGNAPDNGAFCI